MSEYIYELNGEPHFIFINERGEISLVRAGEVVRCRDCKFCGEISLVRAGEVVRCRNCKFCHKNYCEKRISPTVSPSEIFWIPVEPDGFCAWGERRGDAE